VETAEAIGVDVALSGPLPASEPYCAVLAAAISECASNAVKHANGDSLSAEIRVTNADVVFLLRSNGEPPGEAIRETGGLLSLRTVVEKHGGTMAAAVSSVFPLTVRLPRSLWRKHPACILQKTDEKRRISIRSA
jgi:signal transduction histidine kinase